jgi:DNA-binding CsgD family transcriptional regulator
MKSEDRLNVFNAESLKSFGLTHRESEVLGWVAEGKSNKDVGLILGIRSVTVKKHLEHIFGKMGVETRTAAVAFAIRASRRMIEIGLVPVGYFVSEIPDNMTVDPATMLQLLFLN